MGNKHDIRRALEQSGQTMRRSVGSIVEKPASEASAAHATEDGAVSAKKGRRKDPASFWADKTDCYTSTVFDKDQYEKVKRAAWWHRMPIKEMLYRCIETGLKEFEVPEDDRRG